MRRWQLFGKERAHHYLSLCFGIRPDGRRELKLKRQFAVLLRLVLLHAASFRGRAVLGVIELGRRGRLLLRGL